MVTILNDNNFNEIISKSEKKVVVDFFAEWCGPCKMMAPVFESISEKNTDVEFYKVNVDESPLTAQKYGIMSIPTIFVFKNGQPIKKQLGAMSENELNNFIL